MPSKKAKPKTTDTTIQVTETGLKRFLSNLATDPHKLGEFLHKPDDVMSAASLSEADKAALRSGVSGMIAARLAGMPLDQAFNLMIIAQTFWEMAVPQAQWVQPAHQPPYVMAAPKASEVSKAMHPLYFMVGQPPQYVVYPPQFVVQPPPQYVVYPPQFVVQPPPYYPR